MAALLGDITANLNSLSFVAGLDEDERDVLYIRKRSHAVRTCMIGQVCYLVAIINEGKRLMFELENQKTNKVGPRPWKEIPKRRPLRIGILGCGALGKLLIHNLQKYSDIHPEEILVSTRRPEALTEFKEAGIKCFFDNKKLVHTTDLTFVCCLPSQIEEVIEDIKDNVRCLLYSFVAGVPRTKLCKLLNLINIIKPEFIFGSKGMTIESTWDFNQSISRALETASSCELICPGCKDEVIVRTPTKLSELMIYILINMLIVHELSKEDIVKFVNCIVFGPRTDDNMAMVSEDEIWGKDCKSILSTVTANERNHEIFNLGNLHTTTTGIGKTLQNCNGELAMRQRKRFISLFDKFNSWRTDCELIPT